MSEHHDHEHHDHGNNPGESPRRASSGDKPGMEVQDASSRALSDALRSSFFFVKLVMLVLALAFVFAGARIVKPGERAVLLRLGKPQSDQLLEPGLHLAFPPPIDEIVRIPIGEIQIVKSTVGWYFPMVVPGSVDSDVAPARPSMNPAEGYALTGDTNIVHVSATLRYRVKDAVAYAFDFSDASNVVQNVLNNAVMFTAARTTVDQALKQPDVFRSRVVSRVEDQIVRLKLGISLEPAEVRIVAPGYVQEDINAVNKAESESAQAINAARGQADSRIAQARGEASAMVNIAEGERDRYLKEIEKFAASYTGQLPDYKKNTELFRQRLLTETWQQVLTSAADTFFIPNRADGHPRELRISFGRDPEKPKQPGEPNPGEARP